MIDAAAPRGVSGGGVFEVETGRLVGIVQGHHTVSVSVKDQDETCALKFPVPGATFVVPAGQFDRFSRARKVATESSGALPVTAHAVPVLPRGPRRPYPAKIQNIRCLGCISRPVEHRVSRDRAASRLRSTAIFALRPHDPGNFWRAQRCLGAAGELLPYRTGRGVLDPRGQPGAHGTAAPRIGGGAGRAGVPGCRPSTRILIGGWAWDSPWPRRCADSGPTDAWSWPSWCRRWWRGIGDPWRPWPVIHSQDARVTVRAVDVAQLLRVDRQAYDAVLLDVDNGPRGWPNGERLALRSAWAGGGPCGPSPGGSAGRLVFRTHPVFVQRLRRAGFTVDEVRAPARDSRKGRRHTIWLAGRAS